VLRRITTREQPNGTFRQALDPSVEIADHGLRDDYVSVLAGLCTSYFSKRFGPMPDFRIWRLSEVAYRMGRHITIMALTKLISIDDFRKLIDKVESGRDRIVIRLLFSTGCRVEELISTKLEDVDTVKGEIHIHASRTKTRQYRDVIVPQSMIPDLEWWKCAMQSRLNGDSAKTKP
jgi:integrase